MAHCEFIIPYPSTKEGKAAWNKRFGLNAYYAGKHWTKRQQDAEYWHKLVWSEMERQKVRKFPFQNPVHIYMWFNDRLDASNHAAMLKLVEDSCKGRIIKDDNRKYVHGVHILFHDEDCIRIRVQEEE